MQRSTADRAMPSARVLTLREPAAIASGTVIRAMFTSRVHKAPVARGHRQWLEVRR